jgi:plasmid stabilization system protein ParE
LKYIVKIEPDAQNDLEEAAIWYENQKENLGEEFSDEVYSKIKVINENPKLYQIAFKNIRSAVLDQFPFSIFYFLRNKFIHIFAILHQSRNPDLAKDRLKSKE